MFVGGRLDGEFEPGSLNPPSVEFLKAIKAIPGMAYHFACLRNVSQHFYEVEQPESHI